jgi:hypothetical protein
MWKAAPKWAAFLLVGKGLRNFIDGLQQGFASYVCKIMRDGVCFRHRTGFYPEKM